MPPIAGHYLGFMDELAYRERERDALWYSGVLDRLLQGFTLSRSLHTFPPVQIFLKISICKVYKFYWETCFEKVDSRPTRSM